MDWQQQRFWNFYNASMDWKDRLLKGEQAVGDRLTTSAALIRKSAGDPPGNQFGVRKIGLDRTDRQTSNRTDELDLAAESEEESVSDEFLEFIVQTRKHQLEREQQRRELARKEAEVEYKDLTELENRVKLIALKEPELRENLYGEDAKAIYSKELKLQFGFNEFCDKYQPKFWPMIPINLSINQ